MSCVISHQRLLLKFGSGDGAVAVCLTLHAALSDSCPSSLRDILNGVLAAWGMLLRKFPFFGLILIL